MYKRRPEEYDNSVNFKLFTQDLFFFGDADEDSYGNILDKLKYLGISNAFLYLFDYAVDPVKGSSLHLPNKILLKAMMKDGEVSMLSFARQQINTEKLRYPGNASGLLRSASVWISFHGFEPQ